MVVLALVFSEITLSAATIRVNSDADTNIQDRKLTLREALLIARGTLFRCLSKEEADHIEAIHTNPVLGSNPCIARIVPERLPDECWILVGPLEDTCNGVGDGYADQIDIGVSGTIHVRDTELPSLGLDDSINGHGITLDGAGVGRPSAPGLSLFPGVTRCAFPPDPPDARNQVRGLTIRDFSGDGILAQGTTGIFEDLLIFGNRGAGIHLTSGRCPDMNKRLNSHGCILRRNVIHSNGDAGIVIEVDPSFDNPDAHGNTIEQCHIGLEKGEEWPAGEHQRGNGGPGIVLRQTRGNVIGSDDPSRRNVIAANAGGGIVIEGTNASANSIVGNFIGISVTTDTPGGNGKANVILRGGAHDNRIGEIGASNLITSSTVGVLITGVGTSGNHVRANYIGTNYHGQRGLNALTRFGNGAGVRVEDSASRNVIGGDETGTDTFTPGNVILHNDAAGIEITGKGTDQNIVAANQIGVYVTGGYITGSNNEGVVIRDGASNNDVRARNVIGGNRVGIRIEGADTKKNYVNGNYIGTDDSGQRGIGNGEDGLLIIDAPDTEVRANIISGNGGNGIRVDGAFVTLIGDAKDQGGNTIAANHLSGILVHGAGETRIRSNSIGRLFANAFGITVDGSSSRTYIGGTEPGEGNVITGNKYAGVRIDGATTVYNTVRGNAIDANGELGIDLAEPGVTANDARDVDAGPNQRLNYPVIGRPSTVHGRVSIPVSFAGAPFIVVTIDLYSSEQCDGSGHGEGHRWIASKTATATANGEVELTFRIGPSTLPKTFVLTATATDRAGNTSEFSRCR